MLTGFRIQGGGLNAFHNSLGYALGLVEHILDGLTDNGVQGNQNQQRQQAPQAATAQRNTGFLVKNLDSGILLYLVIGILSLNCLNLRGQAGHLHGALLALGGSRVQNELNQNGEQNQRHTIVGGQLIQPGQQVTEGYLNKVPKA